VKTVTISSEAASAIDLLEQARDEDLLVRLADGSEFLLAAIDDFDLEIAQARKNDKLMALLEARARPSQTVPLAEVRERLGL
jgi:hypothetical protein